MDRLAAGLPFPTSGSWRVTPASPRPSSSGRSPRAPPAPAVRGHRQGHRDDASGRARRRPGSPAHRPGDPRGRPHRAGRRHRRAGHRLANGPTAATSLSKNAVYRGWDEDPAGAYWHQALAPAQGRDLEDYAESVRAFKEKRPPSSRAAKRSRAVHGPRGPADRPATVSVAQRPRSFGSSTSRRASPKRLAPKTAALMNTPGANAIHGAVSK